MELSQINLINIEPVSTISNTIREADLNTYYKHAEWLISKVQNIYINQMYWIWDMINLWYLVGRSFLHYTNDKYSNIWNTARVMLNKSTAYAKANVSMI